MFTPLSALRPACTLLASSPCHIPSPTLCALLAGLFLVMGCTRQSAEPTADKERSYANWSPEAEYVGRDVCGSCHPSQYESFTRSQMGRSWKHASRELSDADWSNPPTIYSEFDDLYYEPFARGDSLFVKEFRLAGNDTTHLRVEQIDFIVGSGQHTNSHIYEINGYLYQIPVTWYAQDAKWELAPKFEKQHGNQRFDRVITDECMACHNARPEFVEGSENRFLEVPSGIGCEQCHGPGSLHVEAMRAGRTVNVAEEVDLTIVNPGKLSPERQWDVCRRCHMQGTSVFAEGQSPLDWRPGKVLSSHENVFWHRQPDSTQHFIMASHPDRLAMSACFESTWSPESVFDKMTCLTCHDPHLPIEETGRDAFDQACLQCHSGASEAPSVGRLSGCTEPDVVSGVNSQPCYTCHMPPSGSTDIPNIQITDHFIRVPAPAVLTEEDVQEQTRFIRMSSLIDPKPDPITRAVGFMNYFEQITNRPGMIDSAEVQLTLARRRMPDVPASEAWIRLWYLKEDYAAIIRYVASESFVDPGDAWTWYRIGEAYAASGNVSAAVGWFERAVEKGPDHLRFRDKLGIAYTNAGRIQEAIRIYDQILEDNPLFAVAYNNRGFARLIAADLEGGERDIRRAIELDPDMEAALGNLASLLYNVDRRAEAREVVRRLLVLSPNNPQYQQMWEALGTP